ncbi:MAG TPA: ACP S-malonyltransferase [Chroococcidiopsis sp.]
MNFLIDHNLGGHAEILLGNIASQGWLELLPIRFVTFKEINLSIDSNDRVVWRTAQANQMILLTANRSMKGEDSLEQVLREENKVDSFPVITIGDADRLLAERFYRNRCVDRILEIVLDIETWMGVGRLFIP